MFLVLDSDESDVDSDNEVQFNRTFAPAKQDMDFKMKKFNKPPPYLTLETGEFAEELFKTIVSTHSKVFARDGPRNHKRISYFDSCEPTLRSVIDSVCTCRKMVCMYMCVCVCVYVYVCRCVGV